MYIVNTINTVILWFFFSKLSPRIEKPQSKWTYSIYYSHILCSVHNLLVHCNAMASAGACLAKVAWTWWEKSHPTQSIMSYFTLKLSHFHWHIAYQKLLLLLPYQDICYSGFNEVWIDTLSTYYAFLVKKVDMRKYDWFATFQSWEFEPIN